jgi:hypothetical protein
VAGRAHSFVRRTDVTTVTFARKPITRARPPACAVGSA